MRVGYRVTSTLRVRLEDLAGASAVLDSVADAGGDDLVLNDVRFVLDESVERTAEVRADAWEDAHRRASHLAELAGRRLGAAVQIEEMDADPGPGPRPMRAMAAEAMPALAGGELELSCVLKVRFELAN